MVLEEKIMANQYHSKLTRKKEWPTISASIRRDSSAGRAYPW